MAETIRIEVVDVGGQGGGSASPVTGPATGTPGAATSTVHTTGNQPQQSTSTMPRPSSGPGQSRRRRDEMPMEGRGWQHYLNKEMPFGSFAINNMYAKQENRMGWARDLVGLPDRLERSIIKAQHKAWGNDPNAFKELQDIQRDYRMERFQGVVEKIGDGVVGMAQMAFRPYRGIANETQMLGQTMKTASGTVTGFAMMLGGPLLAGAVKTFSTVFGTAAEVVGLAQGKISEEANRVRGYSPELRMQGIVAGLREMRTDMDIARQFGSQMARQEDMSSRRESAYRLLSTKLATTLTKPLDKMNEAWTVTLEALSGQRDVMDAVANAAAAVPLVGDWFKKDAERRNAEFKEKQNMKDIENGKKLCEDLLGVILPGEIDLGDFRGRPEKKRVEQEAIFDGNAGLNINLK